MANSALYVKLDKETYERLRRLSAAERRQPGDQAALLLREVLEKLIEPVVA
jgi:predicted DNA-binding protein